MREGPVQETWTRRPESAKPIKAEDGFFTAPILTAGSLYYTSREGLRGT